MDNTLKQQIKQASGKCTGCCCLAGSTSFIALQLWHSSIPAMQPRNEMNRNKKTQYFLIYSLPKVDI
jgi:hypothetical protein